MYNRIIGLVLLENGIVSRTRNFRPDYLYIDSFIDTCFFDEIIFIDITRERNISSQKLFLNTIEKLMKNSQLPVSIGGGIVSIKDIIRYRDFGADRYLINQSDSDNDTIVKESIEKFGASSIVSCFDFWDEYTFKNQKVTGNLLLERIKNLKLNLGSEILLNSVKLDGKLSGFESEPINTITKHFDISVILSGGFGNWNHVLKAFQIKNIRGVATSNIYHLTSATISGWRKNINLNGGNVRNI